MPSVQQNGQVARHQVLGQGPRAPEEDEDAAQVPHGLKVRGHARQVKWNLHNLVEEPVQILKGGSMQVRAFLQSMSRNVCCSLPDKLANMLSKRNPGTGSRKRNMIAIAACTLFTSEVLRAERLVERKIANGSRYSHKRAS